MTAFEIFCRDELNLGPERRRKLLERLAPEREVLRELVDTARPSFPRTPFREALDRAKETLSATS